MAVLGGIALTLADWASRLGADGNIAEIVELMSQTNEIYDDMLWMQGNLPTGHKTTVRTGLPAAYWRMLNMGVPPSKSTSAQVTDSCGLLEAMAVTDKKLLELNGMSAQFRLSEEVAFIEGMNQQMATALFYGNPTTQPAAFMGLAPRYPTVNPATAATANYVIDCGGTGNTNTSIWLIMWGPLSVAGIFPKGMKAGLQQRDLGEEPARDSAGNEFRAMKSQYTWDAGITLRDYRYVVRLANIDVTTLSGASPPNLINALIRAVHRLPVQPRGVGPVQKADTPKIEIGRAAFYCNRTVSTWLDIQALNKNNVLLKQDEWGGKSVTSFRNVPIRSVDAILNTEARVV